MSISISEKDIVRTCGRIYAERGRSYQRAGKVRQISWEEAEQTLIGKVAGSGRNLYEQEILVNAVNGRVHLEGYCSCPLEENCKHVAAVLYEWLSRNGASQEMPAVARTKAVKPKTVTSLALWRQRWQAQLAKPTQPAPPAAGRQVLLYILAVQSAHQFTNASLTLLKSRPLQRGGWGKATSVSWSQLSSYASYSFGYFPDWFDPLDREIIELLRKDLSSSVQPHVVGDLGALLLRRLAQSGRCFLQNPDSPPLALGPARRADFHWQTGTAGETLQIRLDGDAAASVFLPTDPPWYIDTGRCQCGPVEQPLPAQLFQALCHLPPVPKEELPALARLLFPLTPAQVFPLPVDLSIARWEEPPVPVLRLFGQPTPGGVIHLARLCFDYGPCRLRPWSNGEEEQPLLHQDGRDWLIKRDPAGERQPLEFLQSLGMVVASTIGAGEAGECDLLFAGKTVAQSAGRWQIFLRDELPRLAAMGWRIETEASFRLQFASAEQLTARIEEEDGGWFEIGLDLEHQGRAIPLLPLLIQFLQEGGDPAQGMLIPEGNGAWLEIPPAVLAPIVQTLFELYQRPSLGAAGQLRLPRSIAPWLDELDRRLGAGGIGLGWQGGERIRALAERLRNFAGICAVPAPASLGAELRSYQLQGLAWLQFLREFGFGGILADDMGLGKTVQTLAHLLVEKEAGRLRQPALVIAPTSVLGNWRREAERFAPSLRVLVLHGPQRSEHFEQLQDYDLLVTSYALLPRDGEVLCRTPLHSVILDEAQAIKNARAKVTQAVCALNAEQRFCLTGTPMENHLGELWSLFHFLMPGFLGQENAFNSLFRQPIEKRGDSERRQELVRRIAPFVLRRDKSEVARELPVKSEIVQSVELEGAQRRLYESIRVAMATKIGALLREKGVARSHIEMLDALLKLRQACCDPRLVKLDSARDIRSSAKLELLLEMLAELLEEGRRVLLFSQFTSMLTLIETELRARCIPFLKLTGQSKNRQELVDRFQQGEFPLFLISLKAGGTGLNLTAADTVIHYDPWWNPAVERQATDRAHRIGQEKPVFVYKLVAADTVEEKILQLQARKQALADDIYRKGKDGDALTALSAEEILSLFAP